MVYAYCNIYINIYIYVQYRFKTSYDILFIMYLLLLASGSRWLILEQQHVVGRDGGQSVTDPSSNESTRCFLFKRNKTVRH